MITPIHNWHKYRRGFTFKQKYPKSFGTLAGRPHLGLDIICPSGTPLYAPVDGFVAQKTGKAMGKTIHLAGDNNLIFRFGHLSRFSAKGKVSEGELIGFTGNTGTATTGAHLHYDISQDQVKLRDIFNFINPETFHKEIKIAFVSPREYDLSEVIRDYQYMGINLVVTRIGMDKDVKWFNKNTDNKEVDHNWYDTHIAPLVVGYDMVALLCDNYARPYPNSGYANSTQRNGSWRCFIKDTKKPRKYYKSHWNGENQVAGTFGHELLHLFNFATGNRYDIHDADQEGEALTLRFNMSKFHGWDVPGYTHLFTWKKAWQWQLKNNQYTKVLKDTEVLKHILIPNRSAPLYRLVYSKFIPKK